MKNTRTIDNAGLVGAVLFLGPPFLALTNVVVFPQFGGEFLHPTANPLFILLFREVRSMHAAAGIGSVRIDSLAAATKDAVVT